MAEQKKSPVLHLPRSPVAALTIRDPGIDAAICLPAGVSVSSGGGAGGGEGEALAERFAFIAGEGVGRYKQEDDVLVLALARWELLLGEIASSVPSEWVAAVAADDGGDGWEDMGEAEVEERYGMDLTKATRAVAMLREKLGALPAQRQKLEDRKARGVFFAADAGAERLSPLASVFALESGKVASAMDGYDDDDASAAVAGDADAEEIETDAETAETTESSGDGGGGDGSGGDGQP